MKTTILTLCTTLCATVAGAEAHMDMLSGDPASGEAQFNRQCVACHVVQNDAGETLAGRNAQTGPNLYGVAARTIGGLEGFRYSDALAAAGADGAVWTEAHFVAYVQDPTGWLRDFTGDDRARSKMSYRVRDEGEAADIYAFLAQYSDGAAVMEAEEASE